MSTFMYTCVHLWAPIFHVFSLPKVLHPLVRTLSIHSKKNEKKKEIKKECFYLLPLDHHQGHCPPGPRHWDVSLKAAQRVPSSRSFASGITPWILGWTSGGPWNKTPHFLNYHGFSVFQWSLVCINGTACFTPYFNGAYFGQVVDLQTKAPMLQMVWLVLFMLQCT